MPARNTLVPVALHQPHLGIAEDTLKYAGVDALGAAHTGMRSLRDVFIIDIQIYSRQMSCGVHECG